MATSSMIVRQKRNLRVLSVSESDNSKILNIFNGPNGRMIEYEFYFNADLRVALDSKSMMIKASVRKTEKNKRVNFLSQGSSKKKKKTEDIIGTLYGRSTDNKNELKRRDKDGLIRRFFIDLSREINNGKIRNAYRLDDRALFGTVAKTKMMTVGEIKRYGGDIILAQREIPRVIDKNSKTFKENYEIAVLNRLDPAQLTFPIADETPADPMKRGTFVKSNMTMGQAILDGAMYQMRAYATGHPEPSGARSTTDGFLKTDRIAVNVTEIDRVRLIKKKIAFSAKEIGMSGRFYISLDLIDLKKKVIRQNLTILINHSQNVEDYYVPRSIVKLKASSSFASPARYLKGTLEKEDKNISRVKIFRRTLYEPGSMYGSKHMQILDHKFSDRIVKHQKELTLHLKKTDIESTGQLKISRALTVGRTGAVYGNFSSSVVAHGPFISYRSNFYTRSTDRGVRIKSTYVCPGVVGFHFMKRDLTTKEKKFKKVIFKSGENIDINEPEFDTITGSETERYVFMCGGKGNIKNPSALDRDVKDGHVYEYRMKLYLKQGVSKFSPNTRIHHHVVPMKTVTVSVSNIAKEVVSHSGGTVRIETSASTGSIAKISFDIEYSIAGNDTSDLLEILSQAGLSDMYDSEIEEVKDSLRSIIAFDVQRYNTFTGETAYLGTASEGTFIDDGTSTPGPAPSPGQKYKYRLIPILISPSETIQAISSLTNPTQTPSLISPSVLSDPSSLTRIRSTAEAVENISDDESLARSEKITTTVSKNFSVSSLKVGTVQPSNAVPSIGSSMSIGSSIIGRYSTGDSYDFDVSTEHKEIKIVSGQVTYGGHGGAIVRWNIASDSNNPVDDLDYFIVIAKKQGKKYIAGNCHAGMSGPYRFIDFTNKEFVGTIEYYILPIRLDGTLLSEEKVGTIIQRSKKKKFRRSL